MYFLQRNHLLTNKNCSKSTNSQQILLANFEDYLNGFAKNVKEIIEKFKLRSQAQHMASKDVLLNVLEKFTSPYINLTPFEKNDPEERKLPALTNLGMGMFLKSRSVNSTKKITKKLGNTLHPAKFPIG